MATKIIKLNNGLTGDNLVTYVPVTVASAVQYSYTGGYMSVQQALGTVAQAVIDNTVPVLETLNTHITDNVNLSYSTTKGIYPTGVHGDGTGIKINAGTGIKITNSGNTLTVTNTSTNTDAKVKVSSTTDSNNYPLIFKYGNNNDEETTGLRFDSDGLTNSYYNPDKNTLYTKYSYATEFTENGTTLGNKYASKSHGHSITLKGSADTTAQTNNLVSVIKALPGTWTTANGTNDNKYTTYTVPTKDYVDNAVNVALTSALKYKGTLGTNGTITTLPTATSANVGDVYVVKTTGDYANVDVNIDGTNETETNKKHLEAGDYVIGTWNGSAYMWSAVNGENQVEDGAATLTVPYTTTASSETTIATVDGTNITLKSKHAEVTYTHPALTDLTPAHGGNFTVIGNVEVKNGHVTKLHTQKVTLPNETQLSRTGTNKSVTLAHGGTFTYISNLNVSNHAITYDYTTATLPSVPNLFQKIANNATDYKDITTYVAPLSTAGTATADSTSDTLNVYGSNYWIKTNVSDSSNNDVLTIGHALSAAGAKTTSDVYSIKIDAAGHITSATSATTGTVGISSLKYKVGNEVDDINDTALGLTFGSDLNIAELTGDKTFVK